MEWTECNPYLTAAACGLAAATMTLARRGAIPSKLVQQMAGWDRWRHSVSGSCLAGGLAAGVALLAHELAAAPVRIGWALVISGVLDIATSEGLAFIGKRILKIDKGDDDKQTPYPQ